MTRKRVGEGLLEAFSETCEHCHGRGVIIHSEPVDKSGNGSASEDDDRSQPKQSKRKRGGRSAGDTVEPPVEPPATPEQRQAANAAIAAIHRAAALEKAEAEAAAEDVGMIDRLATGLVTAALDAESADGGGPLEADQHEQADTAAPAEPVAAEPAAEAPGAEHVAAAELTDAPAADPVVAANGSPARRRRRAASRPAGPPVTTG
jgi:ribonuclease E